MNITKDLVKLYKRPSRNGRSLTYYMDYKDLNGKRQRKSLGHDDHKKAKRQKQRLEKELRMGYVQPGSMRLTDFLEDSLSRTGSQIRESTLNGYRSIMENFISIVGNIDFQQVEFRHGEIFVQHLLDKGNAPDTVAKNVRTIKRFFNLAVERGQLEINPLRFLKAPKRIKRKVRVYTTVQSEKLLKVAKSWPDRSGVRWDILIYTALTTGMRKGELLNAIWSDIDFEQQTITVTPKNDTPATWKWNIKDNEERTLPLIDDLVNLLAEHQSNQPENIPYVFIPADRYQAIQKQRIAGKWNTVSSRCNIVGNFSKHYKELLRRSGIDGRMTFHDLRRTCLSDWLSNGMSIYDVMNLAGHSDITTTQKFYLSVSEDLLSRARTSKSQNINPNLAHICHTPHFSPKMLIKEGL